MHVVVVFYCPIFLKPRLNAVELRSTLHLHSLPTMAGGIIHSMGR